MSIAAMRFIAPLDEINEDMMTLMCRPAATLPIPRFANNALLPFIVDIDIRLCTS